jgi:hypothetical protein
MQDGVLDEISIYNRALSGSEIAEIFAAGVGGKCFPASAEVSKAVDSAPRVQLVSQAGATLTFAWSVATGHSYQVQYKTALTGAAWTNLGSPVIATSSTLSVTDAIGQDPQRFYRLVELP